MKFIRSRVRRLEDAEDILQDVFYQLAKVNDMGKPIEQASAWLYRVARNKIIDSYKKKHEVSFSDFADGDDEETDDLPALIDILATDDATPETETLRALIWEEIESALDELPDAQREVFIQTEFMGLAVKEISAQSGVPVNTLLSRKHYAVVHLRKRLKDLYADVVEPPFSLVC